MINLSISRHFHSQILFHLPRHVQSGHPVSVDPQFRVQWLKVPSIPTKNRLPHPHRFPPLHQRSLPQTPTHFQNRHPLSTMTGAPQKGLLAVHSQTQLAAFHPSRDRKSGSVQLLPLPAGRTNQTKQVFYVDCSIIFGHQSILYPLPRPFPPPPPLPSPPPPIPTPTSPPPIPGLGGDQFLNGGFLNDINPSGSGRISTSAQGPLNADMDVTAHVDRIHPMVAKTNSPSEHGAVPPPVVSPSTLVVDTSRVVSVVVQAVAHAASNVGL